MSEAYKALYEAQVKEHEATHQRLRAAETTIRHLRTENLTVNRELSVAVSLIQGTATNFLKAYPKDQKQ